MYSGMMKLKLRRWIEDILLLGVYNRHEDAEQARKLVMVNTITLMAIVVLVFIGTMTLLRGNRLVAILDWSAAVLLSICILILRRTGI